MNIIMKPMFVFLPMAWLTFLATEVSGKSKRNNQKQEIFTSSQASVVEAENFVNAFSNVFNGVFSSFEHDRAIAVDHIQQVTSSMLSNWEQENQELASLCSSTAPQEECDEATHLLSIQRKQEISDAVRELPVLKIESMSHYLSEFVVLQMQETARRNDVEARIKEIEETLLSVEGDRVVESKLQYAMGELETTCSHLDNIALILHNTITSLNGVVYGNVCFEFRGVSMGLESEREEEYNEGMRKALDFTFMKERVDLEVVGFEVVEEQFAILEERKLRSKKGKGEGPKTLSKSANVLGLMCRCPDDKPVSDVVRRNLGEARRALFSDNILATFATVIREEIPDMFGKLESVSTVHCSEFDYLHTLGGLAGGELDHVLSAASVEGTSPTTTDPEIITPEASSVLLEQLKEESVATSSTPESIIEGTDSVSSSVTEDAAPAEPMPPITSKEPSSSGFSLRLPSHACFNDFQAKYLGGEKQFRSAEQCNEVAQKDPACTGNEFAFGAKKGCICCSPNPGIGDEAYTFSKFYDIYEFN